MTKQEMEKFLRQPHIAKVATRRADGWPSVIPLWYLWDGEYFYLVGRKKSRWVTDLQGDSRVSVLVDTITAPISKVLLEGHAELLGTTLELWYPVAKRMVEIYGGANPDLTYLKESSDQPRWLVRITPTKITTWVIDAGQAAAANPGVTWHPRYYETGSLWEKRYREVQSKSKKKKKKKARS
jgi:PPOX class probable F420-dependent enzyme